MDEETELAITISRIWGYQRGIESNARDLAKTLILKGWRRIGPDETDPIGVGVDRLIFGIKPDGSGS